MLGWLCPGCSSLGTGDDFKYKSMLLIVGPETFATSNHQPRGCCSWRSVQAKTTQAWWPMMTYICTFCSHFLLHCHFFKKLCQSENSGYLGCFYLYLQYVVIDQAGQAHPLAIRFCRQWKFCNLSVGCKSIHVQSLHMQILPIGQVTMISSWISATNHGPKLLHMANSANSHQIEKWLDYGNWQSGQEARSPPIICGFYEFQTSLRLSNQNHDLFTNWMATWVMVCTDLATL